MPGRAHRAAQGGAHGSGPPARRLPLRRPTGTGKTEIAKALAESMFGSETRLVRLDMSEFQTPESLERLLVGHGRRDYAVLLSRRCGREPFSVVLLDEFEKAHANDLGRLPAGLRRRTADRQRQGRMVDFRHAVKILTSNVGSTVATGPALGFDRRAEDRSRGRRSSGPCRSSFRPELLNRIDRVVVFRPLEREPDARPGT